ncbi:MAG: antibiotic biosynthesis monooxygenase [Pseudomonadota bacterium]
MIIRSWRAVAPNQQVVDAYRLHLEETTFQEMAQLAGHKGACLTTKRLQDGHELLVMSFWEDMAAVEAFSKGSLTKAVVKEKTQKVLTSWDQEVEYFEVLTSSGVTI